MSTVEISSFGMPLNLEVSDSGGAGRPVVLIHGWPLTHHAWDAQADALTDAGYRVVRYDRRGFGESDKPAEGYDYDTLADDLAGLLVALDLRDVSLVGFSMGGGEVARYIQRHGENRLRSVVFASAVPPFMLTRDDNPDGPFSPEAGKGMKESLSAGRDEFFPGFVQNFYTAGDEMVASGAVVNDSIAMCLQSDQDAALACIDAFGTTDFREDLKDVTVPTLVLHGDADGIVPFEGSGQRTAATIDGAQTVLIEGGPHGVNATHPDEFNKALLDFLG